MASRRDQLQSYQFMTQRILSAFVMRETDPAQSPLRRGVGAVFAGVMIAVMVAAGFGVIGIITKTGSNNWRTDGAVVVEKESGASFLYDSGVLHPMLNYTSAVLAAGKSTAVFHEASNSLAGVPRGTTLGIPQAPDSLPSRDKLLNGPWTMCTVVTSSNRTQATLLVGQAPQGGRAPGADGLLVADKDGNTYLVWQGWRYLIQQPKTVVAALFGAVTPIPVGGAWLNALSQGADIKPLAINGKGAPSQKVPRRKVGDLVRAQTGTVDQYYVVLDDGLAPLNALQTAIYKGQIATDATDIPVSEPASVPQSRQLQFPTGDGAPPTKAPTLVTQASSTQQLCAATTRVGAPPAITIGASIDQAGAGVDTSSTSDTGALLADRVVVPGGHVALVFAVETADATTGAYYLVTDAGRRYAVIGDTALAALGFLPTDAVKMLSSLLMRIPAGPALDPAAAIKVADG